jgi:hypothetical protein
MLTQRLEAGPKEKTLVVAEFEKVLAMYRQAFLSKNQQ